MVGAVVVSSDGVVVGQGFHRARRRAARRSARAGDGRDRRPRRARCTARSSRAATWDADRSLRRPHRRRRHRRVVAAVEDPNPAVQRPRASRICSAHGVAVEIGIGAAAASRLNQPFFTLMREGRPFVILKAATSLDGCIAAAPGERTQLTSAAGQPARARRARRSRRHRRRRRDDSDRRSAADRPRRCYRERPLTRVVFDRRLRTPPHARVLSTRDAGPVIIVTTAAGAAQLDERRRARRSRARRSRSPGTARLAPRSSALAEREIGSLLLEGGAALHRGGVGRGAGRLRAALRHAARARARRRAVSARPPFRHGRPARAAGRAARPGRADRRVCSPASLKRSASSSSVKRPTGGFRLRIASALAAELAAGDSLAVNGVCLTVIARGRAARCHADVGPETVRVTTLGGAAAGRAGEPRAAAARRQPLRRTLRAGPRRRDRPRRGVASRRRSSTG